jgi:hypothetical protein
VFVRDGAIRFDDLSKTKPSFVEITIRDLLDLNDAVGNPRDEEAALALNHGVLERVGHSDDGTDRPERAGTKLCLGDARGLPPARNCSKELQAGPNIPIADRRAENDAGSEAAVPIYAASLVGRAPVGRSSRRFLRQLGAAGSATERQHCLPKPMFLDGWCNALGGTSSLR